MFDLPVTGFHRVESLLRASQMRSHLALPWAVLEGSSSGRVFTDDRSDPKSAVICNLSGFFFAIGEPSEEFIREVADVLYAQPITAEFSGIFAESPAWELPLRNAFEPKGAKATSRLGFAWQPSPGSPPDEPKSLLPPGFRIEPISAAVANAIVDGTGTDNFGIDPWFIRITGGPEEYAAAGLGVAVMEGEKIASIAGYCGLGGGEAEMEVGTVPAYRGRNLATIASIAFLHQCQQKEWHPAYSCTAQNTPSIAIARKLGFVQNEILSGWNIS